MYQSCHFSGSGSGERFLLPGWSCTYAASRKSPWLWVQGCCSVNEGEFPLVQMQNTTVAALRVLPAAFAIDVFPSLSDRPPIMFCLFYLLHCPCIQAKFLPKSSEHLRVIYIWGPKQRPSYSFFSVSPVSPFSFVSQKQKELNELSSTRGKEIELDSLNRHFSSWQYSFLIAGSRQMVIDCTVWFSSPLRCRFTLQTQMVGHCHIGFYYQNNLNKIFWEEFVLLSAARGAVQSHIYTEMIWGRGDT